jgi:pimeloyl-ACP methyl ester carboxylesterase
MDSVRRTLGLPRLNYIGVSYGTYLGATYAHLFPDTVGRMVLGSVVHPGRTWTHLVRTQVRGFEGTVRRWAATCDYRSTCPYAGRSAYRRIVALIQRLNSAPVTVGDRRYTGNSVVLALRELAFSGASMKDIDRSVRSTLNAVRSAAARADHGRSDGVAESLIAVQWATRCTDWPDRPETFTAWSDRRERWARSFPVFGAMWAVLTVPCTAWPDRPESVADLTQSTAAVPLLIAGAHDPATPLAGARAMARLFGDSRLVRWEGRGHGAIESGDCDPVVTAYVVRGALPDPGTRC